MTFGIALSSVEHVDTVFVGNFDDILGHIMLGYLSSHDDFIAYHLDWVTNDGSSQSQPCEVVDKTLSTSRNAIHLHAPSEKTGTRKPLGPRRRNGIPLGSNSYLTVDMVLIHLVDAR
jgi:hypothetical protein